MKSTYIALVIVILLVLGFLFLGKGSKVEAPVVNTGFESESPSVVSGVDTEAGTVKEFTVTAKNLAFAPSVITVKKGDKVKITFKNENGFHDLKIDEFGIATKQAQSPATEILEFTANKVGSFEYYCSVGSHRTMGMKGILRVE